MVGDTRSKNKLEVFRRCAFKSRTGAERYAALANFENEGRPFSFSNLRQPRILTVFAVRFGRYRKPERSFHVGRCISSDHRSSPPSRTGNPLFARPPGSSA